MDGSLILKVLLKCPLFLEAVCLCRQTRVSLFCVFLEPFQPLSLASSALQYALRTGCVLDRCLSSTKLYSPMDGSSVAFVFASEQAITHSRRLVSDERGEKGRTQHRAEHWVPNQVWVCLPNFTLKEGMLTWNHEQINIKNINCLV